MIGKLGLAMVLTLGLAACAGDEPAVQEPVTTEAPAIPDAPGDAGETAQKPAGEGQAAQEPAAPAAEPVPPPAAQPAATGDKIVNTGALNVRGGPGMSHNVVRVLQGGAKVQTMGCERGWCKIGEGEYVGEKFLSDSN